MESKTTDYEDLIAGMIRTLFDHRGEPAPEIEKESRLAEDLDLDSLELAELSAMLEDDLGRDPYSVGVVPDTVGDLIAFFES